MSEEEKTETNETPAKAPIDDATVRNALASGADDQVDTEIEIDSVSPETEDKTEQSAEIAKQESTTEAAIDKTTETTEYQPSPVWDRIKSDYEKQIGEGSFKMPEGITAENEYDILYQFLASTIEPVLDDVPNEVKEIIELHRQGKYNPEEYFKQYSASGDILKMPDKDFLYQALKSENGKSEKNPDGWEDEDIDEYLSKKTKIELHQLAKERKDKMTVARQQQAQQYTQDQQKKQQEQFEAVQKTRVDNAAKLVNRLKTSNDFFGIEFTPEDKSQFDKDFVEMIKLDPKTGVHKIAEMLQNDEMLYKIAAILWKGEGLKGYITDIKESTKENIEKKLDPTLEQQRGSTKIGKTVDRGKLV